MLSKDVNVSLANWQAAFLNIMDSCIPKVMLRPRKNLPWLTKQLIQATKKKKALFQKAKRTGHRIDYEIYKHKKSFLQNEEGYRDGRL